MHYQRHSFKHNFLNAVDTDADLALDVLVNEINELVLDYPKPVISILRSSGVKLPSKPSSKDLAVLINKEVTTNEELRKSLASLITKRHESRYVNADGGTMDFDFASDAEKKEVPATRISKGIAKTYGVVENIHDTKVDVAATEKVMLENLEEKMAQKGISNISTRTKKIVIGCIIGAAVVGTIIYLVTKKQN